MALLRNKYLEVFYEKEFEVSNLLSNDLGKLHANVCIWECIWEKEAEIGEKGMTDKQMEASINNCWNLANRYMKIPCVILTTFV